MTEYQCNCVIDGTAYSLLTCGAMTTQQALQQLGEAVADDGGDFTRVDELTLTLTDMDTL